MSERRTTTRDLDTNTTITTSSPEVAARVERVASRRKSKKIEVELKTEEPKDDSKKIVDFLRKCAEKVYPERCDVVIVDTDRRSMRCINVTIHFSAD